MGEGDRSLGNGFVFDKGRRRSIILVLAFTSLTAFMVDPFTAGAIAAMVPVLSELATDIFKDSAKEGSKGILSWGGKKISEGMQQQIYNASRQYVETYQERHGILKVLGMNKPVSLDFGVYGGLLARSPGFAAV